MDAFLINSVDEINTYISSDVRIKDIHMKYDNGFIITLQSCKGIYKSLSKKYPFIVPYISNSDDISFKIKTASPPFKELINLINRVDTKYAIIDLKSDNINYLNIIISTIDRSAPFNKLTNRIYRYNNIFLINNDMVNIADHIDGYCNNALQNLYISGFLANLYAFNKNNINNLYVHNYLRYNLIIDTIYNVYDDKQHLRSFDNMIDAVKYLMFLTFSDKEMYNKYIALYPNFLVGKQNEQ